MKLNLPRQCLGDWLRDELIQRLFRNIGILLTGSFAASALGVASLALTARALEPAQFGTLVLISTYVVIMDRLVAFQSWHALIKHGADAIAAQRADELKRLLMLGLRVDMLAALIGTIIAAASAHVVARWFDWTDETILMATVYSVVILFHVSGMPTAVLRLFDRFKLFAWLQFAASVFKLVGVTIAGLSDAGLWAFLLVWALTDILGKLLLLAVAWRELGRRGILRVEASRRPLFCAENRQFFAFIVATNLEGSLRIFRDFDIPMIGMLMSAEAVGLYKVARQISSLISRVADASYQAIYPELARLSATVDRRRFSALVWQSGMLLAVGAALVFAVFAACGEWLLATVFGPDYRAAYGVALWCMAAMIIWSFAQPLTPALLALEGYKRMLWINGVTSLTYPLLCYVAISVYGLQGAGIVFFAFYVYWTLIMRGALTLTIRAHSWA